MDQTKKKNPKNNVKIVKEDEFNILVASGHVKAEVLRDDLNTLDDLNNTLAELDPEGPPLEKGSNVQIGSPTDKEFWIFEVRSIKEDANGGEIALSSNGSDVQKFSFAEFVNAFEHRGATRLQPIRGPEDFISALKKA